MLKYRVITKKEYFNIRKVFGIFESYDCTNIPDDSNPIYLNMIQYLSRNHSQTMSVMF